MGAKGRVVDLSSGTSAFALASFLPENAASHHDERTEAEYPHPCQHEYAAVVATSLMWRMYVPLGWHGSGTRSFHQRPAAARSQQTDCLQFHLGMSTRRARVNAEKVVATCRDTEKHSSCRNITHLNPEPLEPELNA